MHMVRRQHTVDDIDAILIADLPDNNETHTLESDVFTQQGFGVGRGVIVVLRNPIAIDIMHRVNGLPDLR